MKQILMLLILTVSLLANNGGYQFISPVPGSTNNTRESTIIIKQGSFIDASSLNGNVVSVKGSLSGEITGETILSSDNKTIIFKPHNKFKPSEEVTVHVGNSIRTQKGTELNNYEFSFKVTKFDVLPKISEHREELGLMPYKFNKPAVKSGRTEPPTVTSQIFNEDALMDGKIFLTITVDQTGVGNFILVYNNDGSLYYSKEMDVNTFDFKVQPNGLMTYAKMTAAHPDGSSFDVLQMVMDNSFTVVDSFTMGNGYLPEAHEFLMLPNGHYIILGYYLTEYDLSTLYTNGNPSAMISGAIIQELDEDRNVVWQWRSFDHYDIADAQIPPANAGNAYIDAFHVNSIDIDVDNNMLIGTPTWAKKINRQTGEVMYNIGEWLNEFSFVGVDSLTGMENFGGHTFHSLPNGNILIFDNAKANGSKGSNVHEYTLDEENKIATRVWTFDPDTTVPSWAMGSASRLANGNTAIGWGLTLFTPMPAYTEVDAAGNTLMELSFNELSVSSYRAFKFKIPDGQPALEVSTNEIAPGGEYDFSDGDETTGVSVYINSFAGGGYNSLIVKKYNYSSMNPTFLDKAPRVLPLRFVMSQANINSLDADVMIDTEEWGITDPANAVIYHREYEGNGLFQALATTYNHVTGKITANTTKFGEFIVGTPDLVSHTYAPVLVSPKNDGVANQDLPVHFEWAPIGFANTYTFELATDESFSNMVQTLNYATDAVYEMELDDNQTYYWRVKAQNDVGESSYSETSKFSTVAPYISFKEPVADSHLQLGLRYWISWEDIVEDDIEVSYAATGSGSWNVVDTVAEYSAYRWQVPLSLTNGNYVLKVASVENGDVYDEVTVSISDSTSGVTELEGEVSNYTLSQNYPNPFNPSTNIQFAIPESGMVKLVIFDVLGREVTTLVNEYKSAGNYQVNFDASRLASGVYYYSLESNAFRSTRKMILMK